MVPQLRGIRTLLPFVAFLLVATFLQAATPATIVFMSDFGVIDDSVAICKGVMMGIAPESRIVDLTHQVTPYSILDGARFLAGAAPYYPAGTVFLTVIDPGVGSVRKPVVVKTRKQQYFVLPDNGLITLVALEDGIEQIREITNAGWMIGAALSSTFHGRDIFAPVAARLARGEDWRTVGPDVQDLVRLDLKPATMEESGVRGDIIALDGPYGNLITNIDATLFRELGFSVGESILVSFGKREVKIPFVKTFSDVPQNSPLIYVDSRGHIALAVNQGSFAKIYSVQPPVHIFLPRKK